MFTPMNPQPTPSVASTGISSALDERMVAAWADILVEMRTRKYDADWAYRDALAAIVKAGGRPLLRAVASHDEVNTGWRSLLAQAQSAQDFPQSERDPSLSPRTHITRRKQR